MASTPSLRPLKWVVLRLFGAPIEAVNRRLLNAFVDRLLGSEPGSSTITLVCLRRSIHHTGLQLSPITEIRERKTESRSQSGTTHMIQFNC